LTPTPLVDSEQRDDGPTHLHPAPRTHLNTQRGRWRSHNRVVESRDAGCLHAHEGRSSRAGCLDSYVRRTVSWRSLLLAFHVPQVTLPKRTLRCSEGVAALAVGAASSDYGFDNTVPQWACRSTESIGLKLNPRVFCSQAPYVGVPKYKLWKSPSMIFHEAKLASLAHPHGALNSRFTQPCVHFPTTRIVPSPWAEANLCRPPPLRHRRHRGELHAGASTLRTELHSLTRQTPRLNVFHRPHIF
jgi:hypothetical protein